MVERRTGNTLTSIKRILHDLRETAQLGMEIGSKPSSETECPYRSTLENGQLICDVSMRVQHGPCRYPLADVTDCQIGNFGRPIDLCDRPWAVNNKPKT